MRAGFHIGCSRTSIERASGQKKGRWSVRHQTSAKVGSTVCVKACVCARERERACVCVCVFFGVLVFGFLFLSVCLAIFAASAALVSSLIALRFSQFDVWTSEALNRWFTHSLNHPATRSPSLILLLFLGLPSPVAAAHAVVLRVRLRSSGAGGRRCPPPHFV